MKTKMFLRKILQGETNVNLLSGNRGKKKKENWKRRKFGFVQNFSIGRTLIKFVIKTFWKNSLSQKTLHDIVS